MGKTGGTRPRTLLSAAPPPRARLTGTDHVHGRAYLARGSQPRCGCDPDVLNPSASGELYLALTIEGWVPLRRQHVGFVRSRFIYSDRMPNTSASPTIANPAA